MKKIFAFLLCINIILSSLITFVCAEDLPFDDVKDSDWFYKDVAKVWALEIMDGKSPTVFAPKSVMTRAEFLVLLAKIADAEPDGMNEYAAEKYSDVDADAWYAPYVGWGASVEIVTGYTDGTFLPNNPISRQELAVMTVRFMTFQNFENTEDHSLIESFADYKSIGSWARPQVEILRLSGLVGGDENCCFNPKKPASRAEVAAIAGRYCDAYNEYISASNDASLIF